MGVLTKYCLTQVTSVLTSNMGVPVCQGCQQNKAKQIKTEMEENHLHCRMEAGEVSADRKVALITGITGQDGSYLAEFLLDKGYTVHGIIRRSSSFNTGRIAHLYDDPRSHRQGKMILHYGDLIDGNCLVKIINTTKPTEIYNLGAQSHVKVSFDLAEYTAEVDGVGTLRLLDAIRTCGLSDSVRFYQASTSELYGKVQEVPQKETTPFYPRSPYGVARLFAYWSVVNYREAYNMYACNGILFNHESPRRGETFVTRKVTRSLAKIHLGQMESFELGNLDSMRDWGHAKDYVEGKGDTEIGKEKATGIIRLKVNPKFYRPTEVEQ